MKKNSITTSGALNALAIAAAVCAAVVSLGGAAGLASADESTQAKMEFQSRYESALADVAKAQTRYTASQAALRKARQRDRLKGQARIEIFAEIESAKAELEAAQKNLAPIREDARRAGVPPGWLREVEDRKAGETDSPAASER